MSEALPNYEDLVKALKCCAPHSNIPCEECPYHV